MKQKVICEAFLGLLVVPLMEILGYQRKRGILFMIEIRLVREDFVIAVSLKAPDSSAYK